VILTQPSRPAICCIIAVLLYFFSIFSFSTNTPQSDDFFDVLFFLHLYQKTESLPEKLSLLFWQYNEHFQTTSRILYVILLNIFNKIDFFYLTILGGSLLPVTVCLINRILRGGEKFRDYQALIPFLVMLSPSLWLNYLCASYILPQASLLFTVLLIYLLQRNRTALAAAVLFPLSTTLSSGILMLPLSNIVLWMNKDIKKQKKYIFTLISLFLLIFYIVVHIDLEPFRLHTMKEYLEISLTKPLEIIVGFAGFAGSLTFMEGDSVLLPVFSGTILLGTSSVLIIQLWIRKNPSFYPTTSLFMFFLLCLAACSITRVSIYSYSPIFDPHYKFYSLPLWALALSVLYQMVNSNYLKALIIAFAASILAVSYIRYIPLIADDSQFKQAAITKWAVSGKKEDLGYTAILPYSHEILLMSMHEGYYSPFDSRHGALNQVKSLQKITQCPELSLLHVSQVTIENHENAIAFSAPPQPETDPISKMLLCGTRHSFLVIPQDSAKSFIVDKTRLPADNYKILLNTGNNEWRIQKEDIRISGTVPRPPCVMDYGYLQLAVGPLVFSHLCE
jgi:hypothetical protein